MGPMVPHLLISNLADVLRDVPKFARLWEPYFPRLLLRKSKTVSRRKQADFLFNHHHNHHHKHIRLNLNRSQITPIQAMFWNSRHSSYNWAVAHASRSTRGRRFYLANPFNPFYKGNFFCSSYFKFLRASHLSRLNPFHPLNRYNINHWLFRYRWNPMKFYTPVSRAISLSQFPTARIHGPRFFFLSFYYGMAPQAHGRLFTTYACGGPIPNFAFLTQMTTEAIKNITISIRTLLNLDKSIKPPNEEKANQFNPYPNKERVREVKLMIRLNKSLQPMHAKSTIEIGTGQGAGAGTTQEGEQENNCASHDHHLLQQEVASGCYVDFALGDQLLSIPSMTFLTEEIMSEINANLSYILRKIEELRADFRGLSELGELPIKYLPKENTLRVYFYNCDRDKLEMLLKEKNITGGIIHEDFSSRVDCIGGDADTLLSNIRLMPPPTSLVVGDLGNITEHDLLSTMYQSGTTELSEDLGSTLFEDDLLSLSGLLSDQNQGHQNDSNRHHPLMDAEVVRIEGMAFERGPITISDSSGDYFTFER